MVRSLVGDVGMRSLLVMWRMCDRCLGCGSAIAKLTESIAVRRCGGDCGVINDIIQA